MRAGVRIISVLGNRVKADALLKRKEKFWRLLLIKQSATQRGGDSSVGRRHGVDRNSSTARGEEQET